METRAVLALDISKKSTGVCLISITDGTVKIDKVASLKVSKSSSIYNKLFWQAGDMLVDAIETEIEEALSKYQNLSIAFEYPVFGTMSSELQFYLQMRLLQVYEKYHLDAVGYSVPFLKKFIKLSAYLPYIKPKKPKARQLDKGQIEDIYLNQTLPLNPGVLPAVINDSDQYDAIYLALLAIYFQVPYLSRSEHKAEAIFKEYLESASVTCGSALEYFQSQSAKECLLPDAAFYRLKFKEGVSDDPSFIPNNLQLKHSSNFQESHKVLLKDAFKNFHLSMSSAMFYPFSKMYFLNKLIKTVLNGKLPDSNLRHIVSTFLTTIPQPETSAENPVEKTIDEMVEDTLNNAFDSMYELFKHIFSTNDSYLKKNLGIKDIIFNKKGEIAFATGIKKVTQ